MDWMEKTALYEGGPNGPAALILDTDRNSVGHDKLACMGLLPEVQSFIDTLVPEEGSRYVLINAMGASEYYGKNSNHDAFPEASLVHFPSNWKGKAEHDKPLGLRWTYGAPTFYQAGVYPHHRNQSFEKRLGDVAFVAWNDFMKRVELVGRLEEGRSMEHGGAGFWRSLDNGGFPSVSMGARVKFDRCFAAGTLVRTRNGHKPVEQVSAGDEVLTHTRRYKKVTATFVRKAPLLRVSPRGMPDLVTTSEHPFLVLRQSQARTCIGSANGAKTRHTFSEGSSVCRRCKRDPGYLLEWATAGTLLPGDFLVAHGKGDATTSEHSPAFARTLGYYLGDGHINHQRAGRDHKGPAKDSGVGFTVGLTEASHLARLLDTLSKMGTKNEPRIHPCGMGKQALSVTVFDQPLAAKLQEYGGRYSSGKRLAEECFTWPEALRYELVAGYIDTDGSFDAKSGTVRIASINRGLLLDVQRLLLSLGVVATVGYGGVPSGGFETTTPRWMLHISAREAQKFLGATEKVQPHETTYAAPSSFFWKGYWLTPIKDVTEEAEEGLVYNFSVEEDETYVAEGLITHNCSLCTDLDAFYKALATFDPSRHAHPGMAVLEVHNKIRESKGLQKGEVGGIRGIGRTRAEYCSCMKERSGQIDPKTGIQIFVYNDFPLFFDISLVFVGADRTAKVMKHLGMGTMTKKGSIYVPSNYNSPVQVGGTEKTASDEHREQVLKDVEERVRKLREPHRPKGNGAAVPETGIGGKTVEEALRNFDNYPTTVEVKTASSSPEDLAKKAAVEKKARLAKKAEMDKKVDTQFSPESIPTLARGESDLPKNLLKEISNHPLPDALATAGSLGIILRPREYQRVVLLQMEMPALADQLDGEGRCFGYQPPSSSSSLGGMIPALARILASVLPQRSGHAPFLRSRMDMAIHSNRKDPAPSPPNKLMDKLASDYQSYRQSIMQQILPSAQQSMASTGDPVLTKVAALQPEEIYNHLSYAYFRLAFQDEVAPSTSR